MLSVAEDHFRDLNPQARLEVYDQELNPETYAVCRSDMMLKGQDAYHIVLGNMFSEDAFPGQHFDYLGCRRPGGRPAGPTPGRPCLRPMKWVLVSEQMFV